ncbi:MAG: TerB family tellurite resistance protein [Clostridiales bacterium]|nr:TerB family tellurite resistance protein [Clostridiales bacterium]MBR5973636.1 TerB family tellurite resistance protein [Clostridiales bacterium]
MLGRMLARSITRNVAGDMLGGLGRAAAFGAGAVLVSELVNGATQRSSAAIPAGNYMPMQGNSTPQASNNVANIALARIALCYYIAKADGSISPEEQMDLDYMCSSLMNNPNASSNFRTELQSIVNDRSMNFMNVEKYLNRLDVNTLNLLLADAQRIAELTDGVTENERKAMTVFQNYIYGKQGFPGGNMNAQFAGTARVINLKCTGCGADLQINDSRTETYCPYCGSKQIIMH